MVHAVEELALPALARVDNATERHASISSSHSTVSAGVSVPVRPVMPSSANK